MESPRPSTDGRDLSTTLGLIEAHPSSHGRTLSTILGSAVHGPGWTLADGSSGIDGSGCSTSVDPSAGTDGCELDGGRAADDSSGFAKKWLSGLPKSLSHNSSNPLPRLGGAWSRLDTGNGSSGIDGSGFSTSVDPPAGPEGGELDNGRAAGDSSGFAKKMALGVAKELKPQLVQTVAWAWRCMVRAGHW
jgi:hypothetical protein